MIPDTGTVWTERKHDHQGVFLFKYQFYRSHVLKDTANPLSHHVMASSNCFSSTQALAPNDKRTHEKYKRIPGLSRFCERFDWVCGGLWVTHMIQNHIQD